MAFDYIYRWSNIFSNNKREKISIYYDADDEFESDAIEIRHDILYFADFDINELYNCIYEYYSVLYK